MIATVEKLTVQHSREGIRSTMIINDGWVEFRGYLFQISYLIYRQFMQFFNF